MNENLPPGVSVTDEHINPGEPPLVIGFTGSRDGMALLQQDEFVNRLIVLMANAETDCQFHHGDCKGADEEARHEAAAQGYEIHRHPPVDERLRANTEYDETYPPRGYLERDQDIVDACDVLIAAPKGFKEELRSGTWATIRKARKAGRQIFIIWPDGMVSKETSNDS